MQTILFVDGENFKKKCAEILRANGIDIIDWRRLNFNDLFQNVLGRIPIERKLFYSARLVKNSQTLDKSEQLIERQRQLKTHLENQGFEFLISGCVRGHEERDQFSSRTILVFREKGVDVKMAVDLIAMACDGLLKRAIIASSDSDLQPAIKELNQRGVECIYLGFETSPNKGLTYTTKRTILIRNSEVLNHFSPPLL